MFLSVAQNLVLKDSSMRTRTHYRQHNSQSTLTNNKQGFEAEDELAAQNAKHHVTSTPASSVVLQLKKKKKKFKTVS